MEWKTHSVVQAEMKALGREDGGKQHRSGRTGDRQGWGPGEEAVNGAVHAQDAGLWSTG